MPKGVLSFTRDLPIHRSERRSDDMAFIERGAVMAVPEMSAVPEYNILACGALLIQERVNIG